MTTAVILADPAGYTERARAMMDAHPNTHVVTTLDRPLPHATTIAIPKEWLPVGEVPVPGADDYKYRCWFRAHTLGLAAIMQLCIEADFYWFIESDCVASQDRWKALFADHASNPADCVSNPFHSRPEHPTDNWWGHPGTPPWASHCYVPACHRLSLRAVAMLIETAEETREFFTEHCLGSSIVRAGLTRAGINDRQQHWTRNTYRTTAFRVIRDRRFIMHPVKLNCYGP